MAQGERSTTLSFLAAVIPALVLMAGSGVSLVATGLSSMVHRAEELGSWAAVLGLTACVGAAATGRCLWLTVRGGRGPSLLAVAWASLPWLAGILATVLGAGRVEQPTSGVEPMSTTGIASEVSQALIAQAAGAFLSAALLGGLALGLGLASVACRAPNRSAVGLLVGAVAALPLLVLAAYPVIVSGGSYGLFLVCPLMGGAIALALAGLGAGSDVPHGRSAALAAASAVPAALATVGSASAMLGGAQATVMSMVTLAEGSARPALVAQSAEGLEPLSWVATWGFAVGLLSILGMGAWSRLKSRPSSGQVVGGVVLVMSAALVPAAAAWASGRFGAAMASYPRAPWDGMKGFEPLVLPRGQRVASSAPVVLVGMEEARVEGKPVPLARGALADAFRSVLTEVEAAASQQAVAGPRGLPVAIAPGLPADSLRVVVNAAVDAGARSLAVLGAGSGPTSGDARKRIERVTPLLAFLARGTPVALEVMLEPWLAEPEPNVRHEHFRAEIGQGEEVVLAPPPGTGQPPRVLGPVPASAFAGGEPVEPGVLRFAHFIIEDDATAEDVVTAAGRAEPTHVVVLHAGPVPARFVGEAASMEQPAEVEAARVEGDEEGRRTASLDGSQRLGNPPREAGDARPKVSLSGAVTIRGGLSEQALRQVARAQRAELRACYQQGLERDAELAGRVIVQLMIGPGGAVQGTQVNDSSLGNREVEQCILARVRRWRVPPLEGGGIAVVTYPLDFRPR